MGGGGSALHERGLGASGRSKKAAPEGVALEWIVLRSLESSNATTAPLTTTLPADCGLTLALPLGGRLLVKATLAKLRIETGPLYFPLESTKSPLEALIVLNRYFQKATTPLRHLGCKTRNIVTEVASGKSAFTMERVGVEQVLVPIAEEIFGPWLEGRHGNAGFYVLDHHHGQL